MPKDTWDVDEVNPNVVTHEVKVGGHSAIVADDLQEGYGDEKSFGDLTQDVIGELTGDNKLAVEAGENARATHNYRTDLVQRSLMEMQRFNGKRPVAKVFPFDNGDAIMVASWWNPSKECYLIGVGHWIDRGNGDGEMQALKFEEVKP